MTVYTPNRKSLLAYAGQMPEESTYRNRMEQQC